MHVRLSVEEKVPAGHVMHAELPLTAEIEPPGHSAHSPCRVALNFPGRQAVHAFNGSPSSPAKQLHELDAAGEVDWAGHGMQTSGDALYFPASHVAHGPPAGPTHPGLHVHVPLVSPMFGRHVVQIGYLPDTVQFASKSFFGSKFAGTYARFTFMYRICMYN